MSAAGGMDQRGRLSEGAAAQARATEPRHSVWVSAHAGTGKTHVLVHRLIRLLWRGAPPERILCLTFTKAAAAEMARRLYNALGRWATLGDHELGAELWKLTGDEASGEALARARRLFARALETPGGLKIQTIHAFAESLLGRFPLESGVAPYFEVVDEHKAAELLGLARNRLFRTADAAAGDPLTAALARITALVDEEAFASLMAALVARRGRLRRLEAHYGGIDGLRARTFEALGLAPGDSRARALGEITARESADEAALSRAAAALARGGKTDRQAAGKIARYLAAEPDERDFEDYKLAFLRTDDGPRKRLATKDAVKTAPGAEDVLRAEQARIGAAAARLSAVALAEATDALLTLGLTLVAGYEEEKRSRALLDYDDLILATRDLLKRPGASSWVLYKLDGGLDHVLIDEAQDTSPEQWEIVEMLTDEFFAGEGARAEEDVEVRTVFAVGDEKQSIFSFQGADPDKFDQMRAHFHVRALAAERHFAPVTLALSYRSAPEILEAVDAVFAAPDARDGLYSGAAPLAHEAFRKGAAGRVELWPTVKPSAIEEPLPWDAPLDQLGAANPRRVLARLIAEQIALWLGEGEILASRGRPVRPSDIMILVRRRDAFVEEMVRALKERNIPVAGRDRMVLTDQIAVMDLLAAGEFALLPEDDLGLATLLKSPLVGFGEDDLFALAHGREGSLWDALRARAAESPYGEAVAFLEDLRAEADYVPPFEFYSRLLGPLGGRTRMLGELGWDAEDPIDEFLSLALQYEENEPPSLQGFLHWVRSGEVEIKRDMEEGRDEVRVMTVHGAKGLEAGIVFLPDSCQKPQARRAGGRILDLPPSAEGEDPPLFLWCPRQDMEIPSVTKIRETERTGMEREYRRLLYVAMTRAEDRLYLCGWEGARGIEQGSWYDLAAVPIRELARPHALFFGETGWRIEGVQREPPEQAPAASSPHLAEEPAWLRAQARAEPADSRPLAPSRFAAPGLPETGPPALSPLRRGAEDHFLRGLLVHRLIELLPGLPPEERLDAARRFLARPGRGLAADAQDALAREVLAILENPAFAPLFGPESRAEVPVAGRAGSIALSGRIDRLVVEPGRVFILDFKTNRPPPERPRDVPALYLRQMAAYRAALARIFPDRPIECALLWTVGPRLMVLADDQLAPHAPGLPDTGSA